MYLETSFAYSHDAVMLVLFVNTTASHTCYSILHPRSLHYPLPISHVRVASRWQRLRRIALPLALPSIMAGLNQSVMMALSMVVVASMIGARGLGEDVLAGIQTLNVGQGVEAGLAIVALAMVIDRISQAYGRPGR